MLYTATNLAAEYELSKPSRWSGGREGEVTTLARKSHRPY